MQDLTVKDLLGLDRENVLTLGAEDVHDRRLTQPEVNHILASCDALWLHDGNPSRPHAELTSGLCSDGFINVGKGLVYPNLVHLFGRQLYLAIREEYPGHVDWVVSSDHAAAVLGFATAFEFEAKFDFCEKGPDKTQVWRRQEIAAGEIVLQVEELMTTAGTLEAVRWGVVQFDRPTDFAPVVGVLINRSSVTEIGGSRVVALARYHIQTWPPEDCPLCAVGSKRLRPKQHWAELTGA